MTRRRSLAWLAALIGAAPFVLGPLPASEVVHEVTVTGDLFAGAGPDVEPIRRPIALRARFAFSERPEPAAGTGGVVRRYTTAAASIDADGVGSRKLLGRDGREVLVTVQGTTVSPYLADGFLSREECDLLDTPFDPLLVDRLRPDGPAAVGDSWEVQPDLVAGLLAIDTVESGGLQASLVDVADGRAQVRLAGTVTGAVDGVPTRLEVQSLATIAATSDAPEGRWRLEGRVADLEATIKERRQAGWVAPGLDVEARIVIHRAEGDPKPEDAGQAGEPAAEDLGPAIPDRPRGPGRPGRVWHRHPGGQYAIVMDGRWRVVEDGPEGLVMRFVDRGALIGQCSILPLPPTTAEAPPTEATVRADVRRSLADQFGHIVESEATTREDGNRVVRVVVDGSAEGRPFRWIHHVLTDPAGHQAAVTCMLEPALADRFAAADRELVAGLVVLREPPPRSAATDDPARR